MQDGDVLLPESDSSIRQRHKDTSKASGKKINLFSHTVVACASANANI